MYTVWDQDPYLSVVPEPLSLGFGRLQGRTVFMCLAMAPQLSAKSISVPASPSGCDCAGASPLLDRGLDACVLCGIKPPPWRSRVLEQTNFTFDIPELMDFGLSYLPDNALA